MFSHNKEPNKERAHAQHANFVIGHLAIGHFVIGHFSCARCNLVKNRACKDPIRFENLVMVMISNGNRTEWSPIRSVIIRVINKIGRPRSGSPICLITSMITDRLSINHKYNKIREKI